MTTPIHADMDILWKTIDLACDMKYISGWLTVHDDKNAEGAKVVVDELGLSCEVGEKLRLPIGEYMVEVRKDGYMLDDGILDIKIEEDKEVLFKLSHPLAFI